MGSSWAISCSTTSVRTHHQLHIYLGCTDVSFTTFDCILSSGCYIIITLAERKKNLDVKGLINIINIITAKHTVNILTVDLISFLLLPAAPSLTSRSHCCTLDPSSARLCSLLRFTCTVVAFLEPGLVYVPFNTFSYHLSVRKVKKKTSPLCLSTVSEGFHYSFPAFKAHTLVGWPFSGLLCKMWRQDSPLLPPPAPTESGRLFNAHRPTSSFLFSVSDVRLCTDIHTQRGRWVLKGFIYLFFNLSFSFFIFFPLFSLKPLFPTLFSRIRVHSQSLSCRDVITLLFISPWINYIIMGRKKHHVKNMMFMMHMSSMCIMMLICIMCIMNTWLVSKWQDHRGI